MEGTPDSAAATWDEFLAEWPPERVRRMTLDDYTNAKKNSFAYAIEFGTMDLGSIRGGSSFKFGVYARNNDEKPPGETSGRALNATHGWQTKYGASPAEAFAEVRDRIVSIIDAARAGDTGAIDDIEFADATKWKIAFLYQDRTRPSVLPIFKPPWLRSAYKAVHPAADGSEPFSEMYRGLLDAHHARGDVLAVGRMLWTDAQAEESDEQVRNADSAPTDAATRASNGGAAQNAGARLEGLFPDPTERAAVARLIMSSAQRAAKKNPRSWSITQKAGGEPTIRLNVGWVRTMNLRPGRVELAIQGLVSDAVLQPWLRLGDDERIDMMGDDNGLAVVPVQELALLPPTIVSAHERYIDNAAGRSSGTDQHHDEALTQFLAALAGAPVPPRERSLRLAESEADVRASIAQFATAVKQGAEQIKWAFKHPDNWVYDEGTKSFAPSKFCAFLGMNPEWYRRLQDEARDDKGQALFDGTRTRKAIEKLSGKSFVKDERLVALLRSFMTETMPEEAWGRTTTDSFRFLTIPARAGDKATPEPTHAAGRPNGLVDDPVLNRILVGPPGTGKTWATARLAVSICDGVNEAQLTDRKSVMKRYGELKAAGRIAFVTFHQSYGYEEFVEGIRPVLDDEEASTTVSYECRPGVFKRLCEAAAPSSQVKRSAVTAGNVSFRIDPEQITIWKMSLGNTLDPEESAVYDDAIKGGYIALGYGKGLDYTGCDDREAVLERLRRDYDKKMDPADFNVTSVNIFKNKMKDGDAVIVSDGNHKFRAIGRIKGSYAKPPKGEPDQQRAVEWVATFEPSLPAEQIKNKAFSQQTIYELKPNVLKLEAVNALLESDEGPPKPHVMIIDELNRGNVSKILGELITLLEPDKRLGRENALTVTLPHSNDDFGVPSNVYVIGTMNTADRSIAFLDTALRRRFEFTELLPDYDVIRDCVPNRGVIGGIDVAALLQTLNDRIELLYDRDHTLGHAFFVGVRTLTDLREVFLRKVLPLLQEYFYGDWEKLCQVLGCPYDPERGTPRSKNAIPIVTVTPLSAKKLILDADSIDLRVKCAPNRAFLDAGEAALRPFFAGVMTQAVASSTSGDDDGADGSDEA